MNVKLEKTYDKNDLKNRQRTAEILEKIRFVAMSIPQFRIGQILCNVLEPDEDLFYEDLFYIHDGELLQRLNAYIKDVMRRKNFVKSKPMKLSITKPEEKEK